MYKITKKYALNNDVDAIWVKTEFINKNAKPGHFVIVRAHKDSERIPLTIVDTNDDEILLIIQKVGFSTIELCALNENEYIYDIVGPLGKAIEINEVTYLLAVAGGVGAAPLLPQVREYAKKETTIDLIIGARDKEHLILLDEFKKYCHHIYIYTDNGEIGEKGFVTKDLDNILNNTKYNQVIAIGPIIMMKNVSAITKQYNIKTYVSLNPIMIDGTGMCGNCRVTINNQTFFACVDGPDFMASGINFDELLSRQNFYQKEEHSCKMGLNIK